MKYPLRNNSSHDSASLMQGIISLAFPQQIKEYTSRRMPLFTLFSSFSLCFLEYLNDGKTDSILGLLPKRNLLSAGFQEQRKQQTTLRGENIEQMWNSIDWHFWKSFIKGINGKKKRITARFLFFKTTMNSQFLIYKIRKRYFARMK